ncbi:cyanophycinase [Gemmatimonas sp.]|jgi:cyanophycinase|uniref:cyanophycinase n=1 Tax=Gemmatimonas sp. TaxID=1962908 RepID=UPI0037BE2F94
MTTSMLPRRIAATLLLSTFTVFAPLLGAQSRPAPRGTLFIVGGGTQPAALVEDFVKRSGGSSARIVVFAMASASGERSGEAKAKDLQALGAQARNIWITRAQADNDSIVQLLDGVTGVWFGGGDQNRLAAALRGSKVERAIRARYNAGAVVGGTSAGAAVISSPMITGEELLRKDTTETWTRVKRGTVQVDSGFSYITNAVIDQHFLRRKRHNRLMSLVLADAPHLGIGIDEGTALIVEPSGLWRIAGASAALIIDAREATRTAADRDVLGASNVRMHLLPDGATFDPKSGKAALGGAKQ